MLVVWKLITSESVEFMLDGIFQKFLKLSAKSTNCNCEFRTKEYLNQLVPHAIPQHFYTPFVQLILSSTSRDDRVHFMGANQLTSDACIPLTIHLNCGQKFSYHTNTIPLIKGFCQIWYYLLYSHPPPPLMLEQHQMNHHNTTHILSISMHILFL